MGDGRGDMPLISHSSPSNQSKLSLKLALTPGTMSTSEGSSFFSLSPMNGSGEASSGEGTPRSLSQRSSLSQQHSLRFPVPSPSRPRLHPSYAARLAPSMRSAAPRLADAELRPPPGITRDRNDSIFRPTPIITCTPEHDVSEVDCSMEQAIFLTPTTMDSSSLDSLSPRRLQKRTVWDIGASDRYIPSRATSSFNFNLWDNMTSSSSASGTNTTAADADSDDTEDNASYPTTTASQSQQASLNALLRSELLGENQRPATLIPRNNSSSNNNAPLREGDNNLRYQSPRQVYQDNIFAEASGPTSVVNSFSLMPIGSAASQRLMASPQKRKRRISKVPFKVLDAPALQDDFYLNLVDWSSQNVLAVGLGSCVYLWSACTSKVTKLCDLAASEDIVTAVSWSQRGTHLSVGTNRGEVQLWDTVKCKKIRSMPGHSARVGTLAWTGPILASGSRDRLIFLRDVRVPDAYTEKLSNHKQEICGLKWSFDEPAFLASGGNDNQLHVIDSRRPHEPIRQFSEHTAAVKAIAWSPHQHGLLASGGGTADRCIRFWNTLSGASLNKIDTGSQVCNLAWSQNCNEMVSTHGYSLNQICLWRYPTMSKVATLTGHTYRVLYLSMSPDGSTIVTGAGDETLRFWQVFPGPRADGKDSTGALLFPATLGSVIR